MGIYVVNYGKNKMGAFKRKKHECFFKEKLRKRRKEKKQNKVNLCNRKVVLRYKKSGKDWYH